MTDTFPSFDGTTIAFRELGAGPCVLLVHGFIADGDLNWVRPGIAAALAERGRRVVVVDLRGHGMSDKPHRLEAYEDRALARDVVALADHLELDAYDLVGYSLGSIVATTVALLDPRVRSLVLGGIGDRLMDGSWKRPKQLVAQLLGDPVGGSDDPSIAMMLAAIEQAGGDRLALAGVQHGHVTIGADELQRLSVPTLVIVGKDDDVNGEPAPLTAAIDGARLVRVAGDHLTAVIQPSFLDAVVDHLDRFTPTQP